MKWEQYRCDHCGSSYPARAGYAELIENINFPYPSEERDHFHFCRYDCLLSWIKNNRLQHIKNHSLEEKEN